MRIVSISRIQGVTETHILAAVHAERLNLLNGSVVVIFVFSAIDNGRKFLDLVTDGLEEFLRSLLAQVVGRHFCNRVVMVGWRSRSVVSRWRGSEFFGGATALCHSGHGRMGVHGRL